MTFETTFLPALPVLEQIQEQVPEPAQGEQAAELRRAERAAAQAAAVSFRSQPERRSQRILEPI
jgi:hypothetical protein